MQEIKENIQKFGFYVKRNISILDYAKVLLVSIVSYIFTIGLLLPLVFILLEGTLNVAISIIIKYIQYGLLIVLWICRTYQYSNIEYSMYLGDNSVIVNKKIYTSIHTIPTWINKYGTIQNISIGKLFLYTMLTMITISVMITSINLLLYYLLIVILGVILAYILRHLNPINYFLAIGLKIQNLSPQIKTQKQFIEENFTSDMSFKCLSDGFDGLASTFSQIVSLVIQLEGVEQKINKGNLFDSEKYISSLKLDIVGPLHSLRGFLDSKRTELTRSREELSRVGVKIGGAIENRDLTSARTEPLILELTENIEKLDMMIGKMR